MKQYTKKDFLIHDFITATGITFGTRWNGWECPFFDFQEAQNIIKLQDSKTECLENGCTYYEISLDGLHVISTFEDGVFVEDSILVDGVRYYPIGYMNWVWEVAKPIEQDEK